jgi:hypothetical protein
MMRRLLAVVGTVLALGMLALPASAAPSGVTSNDFETNTAGWFDNGGTITQRPSLYANPGGYASGIDAAGGSYFAGLNRGPCVVQVGGGGNTVYCSGPYTDWGNLNNYTWNGPYTTQVDIYLDTAYAQANPDTYGGNWADLTGAGGYQDSTVKGTRFDYTSAINSSIPDVNGDAQHLRDFGFNVSTGYAGDGCDGFMITGQTVVNRINANPNIGQHDPQCIAQSGWYTFKHSFSEDNGYLKVVMEIIPVGETTAVASWTITGIDPISTVGCNRYGWFSDQEMYGLPIDNASMTGCGQPAITDGQIAPTKTTCEQYRDGTAPVLGEVLYTTKGDSLNALSPGVFFYYAKVSGTAGQTVDITQTNDGNGSPPIPIQNGQVVLYDASTCTVLKWEVTEGSTGEATGILPSSGDFIVGVKYSPSDLKGEPALDPETVTYSFGTTNPATVDLAKKH